MATGAKNAKSQMTTVRIPHEVMDDIEQLKEPGESTAGFLVTAAKARSNAASAARPKNRSNHHQRRGVRDYGASFYRAAP